MADNTQNELQVIVLAKRMMKHSILMANNQNRFPKKYRFSLVNAIQDDARNIVRCLLMANHMHTGDTEQLRQRLEYQLEAICLCDLLLLNIEIALDEHCIGDDSCEYWTRLVMDVKRMAISWRNSDMKRYRDIKSCVK